MNFQVELRQEIYNAVKEILKDLFQNKEHFYYVTLTTDGLANTPCVSAWSYEALEKSGDDEEEREEIKWSYADSPYCCWKQEKFDKVKALLLERGPLNIEDDENFDAEYNLRFDAMEWAMTQLDQEGIFNANQGRKDVMVLVEVMPPDETNTERAYRMNDENTEIFQEWLETAAE